MELERWYLECRNGASYVRSRWEWVHGTVAYYRRGVGVGEGNGQAQSPDYGEVPSASSANHNPPGNAAVRLGLHWVHTRYPRPCRRQSSPVGGHLLTHDPRRRYPWRLSPSLAGRHACSGRVPPSRNWWTRFSLRGCAWRIHEPMHERRQWSGVSQGLRELPTLPHSERLKTQELSQCRMAPSRKMLQNRARKLETNGGGVVREVVKRQVRGQTAGRA